MSDWERTGTPNSDMVENNQVDRTHKKRKPSTPPITMTAAGCPVTLPRQCRMAVDEWNSLWKDQCNKHLSTKKKIASLATYNACSPRDRGITATNVRTTQYLRTSSTRTHIFQTPTRSRRVLPQRLFHALQLSHHSPYQKS